MPDISEHNLDVLLQQGLNGKGPLARVFNKIAADESEQLKKDREVQDKGNNARGFIVNPLLSDEEIAAAVNAKLAHEAGPDSELRKSIISAAKGDATAAFESLKDVTDTFQKVSTFGSAFARLDFGEMIKDFPDLLQAIKDKGETWKNAGEDAMVAIKEGKFHGVGDVVNFFVTKLNEGKSKETLNKLGDTIGAQGLYDVLHSDTLVAPPSSGAPSPTATAGNSKLPVAPHDPGTPPSPGLSLSAMGNIPPKLNNLHGK